MYFLGILEQCAYRNTFCFLYLENCVKLPNNCNVWTRHRRTARLSNVCRVYLLTLLCGITPYLTLLFTY